MARALGIPAYLSTDCTQTDSDGRRSPYVGESWEMSKGWWCLPRPHELAQDDTPMIEVVTHALSVVPGPPDQIVVLLQPTQPLRKPEHVAAAIDLLQSSGADSAVSVVELPQSHHPASLLTLYDGRLSPYHAYQIATTLTGDEDGFEREWATQMWNSRPSRRQQTEPVFRPDGTVYVFRRKTVDTYGTIYGRAVRPLVIPASETCELDTEADWRALEARIRHTMGSCSCAQPTPYTRPSGAVICVNDYCGGVIVDKKEPVARP